MKKGLILIIVCAVAGLTLKSQRMMPVQEGKLWGLINDSGRMVHPAIYKAYFSINSLSWNPIYYAQEGSDLYFLGNNGARLKTKGLTSINDITAIGQYLLIKTGQYYGVRDMAGNKILPDSFLAITLLDSNLFLVQLDKGWTILNRHNEHILPSLYSTVEYQNDFIYTYKKATNTSMLFDKEGKQISNPFLKQWNMHGLSTKNFKLMTRFPDYMLVYKTAAGYRSDIFSNMNFLNSCFINFTDSSGQNLLYHIQTERGLWYPNATINYLSCCNSVAVANDGITELFDSSFTLSNSLPYSFVRCANTVLVSTDSNGYCGLVDRNGREILKPKYASISNFIYGLALYTETEGGKMGVIDERGREILKRNFKRIDIDSAILVCAENDSTRYYYELDAKNNITSSTLFNNVSHLHTGYLRIRGPMSALGNGRGGNIPNCVDCGWFTHPASKLIGLRQDDNSIAIPAVFSGKSRIPNTPYYLVWIKTGRFAPMGDYFTQQYTYGIVDYNLKKVVVATRYTYIDVAAIERKQALSHIRVYSKSRGHELVMPDLKIRSIKYTYVASLSNGNFIAYKKGTMNYKVTSSHYYAVAHEYLSTFTMIARNESIIGRITHPYIEISNADWYLLDSFGNAINPFHPYSYVRPEKGAAIVVIREKRFGIIDLNGNWLLEPKYLNIPRLFSPNDSIHMVLNSSARMGAMNKDGQVIINADYGFLNRPDENTYTTAKKDNNWGVVSNSNVFIPLYGISKARPFNNGLAAVKKKSKWGFVDYKGQIAIDCEYNKVSDFSDGIAAVLKGGSYEYIDEDGNKLFNKQFTDAGNFTGGHALVKTNDRQMRYRLIDKNGSKEKGTYKSLDRIKHFSFILGKRHGRITLFSNNYSNTETYKKMVYDKHSSHLLLKAGKGYWDIVDKQGRLTGKAEAYSIQPFTYKKAVASNLLGQDYVIDETGQTVYGPGKEKIIQVFDTFMVVQEGKQMYIKSFGGREIRFDKARTIVIEAYNAVAKVRVNNKIYTGSELGFFPEVRNNIRYTDLDEEMTAMEQNKQVVLLDTSGFLLNQRVYNKVSTFQYGACVFSVGSTCGLFRSHKGWLIPCNQDLIVNTGMNTCRFEKDNDFGYINIASGKIIWQKHPKKGL